MGRPKWELKKIHKKKAKKAKRKSQLYSKGEISYDKLTQRAKHFLEKSRKQKKS
ncbi:MAG: hypothetical protein ABIE75_02595 [Candidatus Omnitrophota bacterium]